MILARYLGNGEIAICDEPTPKCPEGGLLVKTLASGLCSGELMAWYMDKKIPHVLGHEVCGIVVESGDARFPVGSQVFVHHHAPCMTCDLCLAKKYVHCAQWRHTKLEPGGMAEYFAVSAENLPDTFLVDDLRPVDAALIEPLACCVKSFRQAGLLQVDGLADKSLAVIGLGVMGLLHALVHPNAVGFDLLETRKTWAAGQGVKLGALGSKFDVVIVCPGSSKAIEQAIEMVRPGGTVVLFAPLDPDQRANIDLRDLYFRDITLTNSYSCGPNDTAIAAQWLRQGKIRAEQVVSNFIDMSQLPESYIKMRNAEILKAMVLFPH